ncbi:MAG: gamma carbonic anhydrase family protein [Myxococcales bacterium]|nr:gamma carbonic anhydrase family protein [Myxococcales bacterium]USN50069.1 MAG: gamma carbonic anhydrase family protein [Myxococcales bacterium]
MIESILGHQPQIHPRAFVHPQACVIGQVIIEEGASIWPGVVLRGDMGLIRIGKNTSVQDGSICHMTSDYSETIIGDNVTIGHGVIVHGAIIEDYCLIGMGSILLDQARIGSLSFVAAGSLVTGKKNFSSESFICGSPAKKLRSINEKEKMMCLSSVQHYLDVQKLYSKE